MKSWLRLLPILAAALALILMLGYGFSRPQPFILNNAVLATPQRLPTFELQSTRRPTFSKDSLLGQWSLLFSGYTQCPDVCPTTLSLLTQLRKTWPDGSTPLHLVFVTVDPQQDSLAQLNTYLDHFGNSPGQEIEGVTGSPLQLNRLLRGLGFYPVTEQPPDPHARSEFRPLSHSGAVALINPQGQLHALLRAPLLLEQLQTQLLQIFAAS